MSDVVLSCKEDVLVALTQELKGVMRNYSVALTDFFPTRSTMGITSFQYLVSFTLRRIEGPDDQNTR